MHRNIQDKVHFHEQFQFVVIRVIVVGFSFVAFQIGRIAPFVIARLASSLKSPQIFRKNGAGQNFREQYRNAGKRAKKVRREHLSSGSDCIAHGNADR